MKLSIYNLILLFTAFALCATVANSAVIPLVDGQGTSAGWSIITHDESVNVHVDEVGFDEVTIRLEKTFRGTLDEFGFFSPIMIEFEKTSELARSLIIIDNEIVTNNTTEIWYDYHMALIVNPFNPEAGFSKNTPDGDNLEDVSFDPHSNYGYLGLPIQMDFNNSQGGGVSNEAEQNVFSPGLADGDIYIQTNSIELPVGERFGFKQVPTVPEPATVMMLLLGSVPAICKKCRK